MNNLLLNERSLIYHLRQYRSKRRLHYFAETESTNEVAKKLCGDGKGLGAFVVSDCQTAGKGRSGRTFCSPKGTGVYISIVYEISGKEPNFDLLSSLAGLAVRDTLFNFFDFDCKIKWPNDILLDGKKICGILCEIVNKNGKPKYYGRFNQGVVTINLVDVACTAARDGNKSEEKFWQVLDERLELCHRALQCRHERLEGTLSDAAPILWQYGALARLKKGEPIDKLLHGGYSTLSLGYAGLWECVYEITGKKLTEKEGEEFGLRVMQRLNDACAEWKAAENIDYSIYGTPLESTTYKFAKCLQNRFGIIKGVTDRNYITNSYHIHVTEKIDAFSKLELESKFQKLSPGGAISYVEVPNMQQNIPAVLEVMKFIYNNIMYAELNTKSDYCQVCGYDGEIQIVEEDGKLVWRCPNCGNEDQSKMNVARRTCGYIGSQFWNQGRTQEIKERVLHL